MTIIMMIDSIACSSRPKGNEVITLTSTIKANSHASHLCRHLFNVSYAYQRLVHVQAFSITHRLNHRSYTLSNAVRGRPSLASSVFGGRGFYYNHKHSHTKRFRIYAALDVAGAVDVINDLGLDTLTFLAVTVMIVPAFKIIKASPILGFFFAGIVLNQFGLIRNLTDVKILSEWGILFLLFEMGLELSLARLKALAKFAFGMGLTQVVLCTLAFTAFELPPNGAIGTRILQFLFHSRPDLVNIRSIDEAIVIGAALSLSSSAFVLQLLAEKGELPTRFGSATLGILLLQDIAVVPLLVILPVLESQNLVKESIWPMLVKESLKALGGLGLLSLGGKYLLRRIFEFVAEARSSEAFVALCLLTVAGTSLITQKLGFSDTKITDTVIFDATEPVVIIGFGQMGQVLANFLSTPLASGVDGDSVGWPYVAFDLDLSVVKGSRNLGFPILYGDGSRPSVLQSAGISSPKAVMVMYTGRKRTIEAVQRIRLAFPATPIYARAQDLEHLLDLKEAGATDAILENAETSLQLGSKLLKGLGVMSDDVSFLSQLVRDSMELQAQAVNKTAAQESDVMESLQVRVADLVSTQTLVSSPSTKDKLQRMSQRGVNHIPTLPDEGDQIKFSDELDESEDGRGVLYCELGTDNNSRYNKEDVDMEKLQ